MGKANIQIYATLNKQVGFYPLIFWTTKIIGPTAWYD